MSNNFGRIKYIEPTNAENISGAQHEGTNSDSILFPYEDYNMAVDLSIRMANRYSCGFGKETGEVTEFNYSTTNGSISFLAGSNVVSGSTDGYLSTNYTDISMLNPDSNTQEALGIESINIKYNSWVYPQVDIKFVDVRGATVMQPSEQGYYSAEKYGISSKLYKAFFTYPYPIFTLKVKGFYGRGITYRLAVEKVNLEMDAENGNFIINATFVGYMFGIYADLPMQFLAVAPFTASGKEYWDSNIKSGTFCFNNGAPMITFPALREKLATIAESQASISMAAEGQEVQNNIDERINKANGLIAQFPFKDWLEVENNNYIYKVFDTDEEDRTIDENITTFISSLSGYDETYGTKYLTGFNGISQYAEDGVIKNKKIRFTTIKTNDSTVKYEPHNSKDNITNYDTIVKGNIKLEEYIKTQENGRGKNYYLYCVEKGEGTWSLQTFSDILKDETKKLKEKKISEEQEYKQKQDALVESALGFKPSIKNIYNLAFAHMDTFLHTFYEHNNVIKQQLEGKGSERNKNTYGVQDGYTDTEPVGGKNSNGLDRSHFLPPYTAFYEDIIENNENKKQLQWPGDLNNGENLEEVKFIKELLSATEMYADTAEAVENFIASLGSGETKVDTSSMMGGCPSTNVANFIPLTIYDFVNKDTIRNPYLSVKPKISNNEDNIEGDILGQFALRAYYYLCCNDTQDWKEAHSFGILDAINFYKAVGDSVSPKFLQFIKTYADGKNESSESKEFINAITSPSAPIAKSWDFGESLNANKTLFKKVNSSLRYSLYKPNETSYCFLPINVGSFESIKRDFAMGDKLIDNTDYISITNYQNLYEGNPFTFKIGQPMIGGTFVLYEARDYVKTIYNNVEAEVSKTEEYLKEHKKTYGDRKMTQYGEIKKKNRTFKNYENNLASNFTNTYFKGTVLDEKQNIVSQDDINNIITKNNFDEQSKYFISIPSIDKGESIENQGFWSSDFTEVPMFTETYKSTTDIKNKALIFLSSIPFTDSATSFSMENGLSLKAKLLFEGGLYWKEDKTGAVPSNSVPLSRRNYLKAYFENWATNTNDGFAGVEPLLCTEELYKESVVSVGAFSTVGIFKNGKAKTRTLNPELYFSEKQTSLESKMKTLQKFLRNLFFGVCTTFDYYNGTHITGFNVPQKVFTEAFKGFMMELKAIYGTESEEAKKSESDVVKKFAAIESNDPFKNKDVRLSLYMVIKSLYDKWLCNPYNGPKTWQLGEDGCDFENFVYADSFYHNIGHSLTVNITKVSSWLSSCLPTANMESTEGVLHYTGHTIYQFLTEVAQDCGAVLHALPQKFGIQNSESVSDMFKPISINDRWDTDSSAFVLMYAYKPSEHLGDSDSGKRDMNGWDPNGDGIDLNDEEIRGKFNDDGYSIPSFGVTYAKQNQSIFKNISLNTQSAGVTEVSIATTMNIASKSSESPRETTIFGQDLYRVKSQYAYECSVEMLGNMQVVPLMYFQLNNVPMWKGVYMIQKVQHSITAGDIKTSFTGVRLNKYTIPMTDGTLLTTKDAGNVAIGSGYNGTVPNTQISSTNASNVEGNYNYTIPNTIIIDFKDENITETKPIICITPAHGPKTQKWKEWMWSSQMIDNYLIPILKTYKFKDGTSYADNIQRCNKGGANTGKGYSMKETRDFIKKYGSKKVISVVPHWNGCGGDYHGVFVNKKSNGVRSDSLAFADFIKNAAIEVANKIIEGDKTLPISDNGKKAINPSSCKVYNLGENNSDGAPQLNCACILTENWFADFPSGCKWWDDNNYDKMSNGRFETFRGWLMSPQGSQYIAELHARGIKAYIDSLS